MWLKHFIAKFQLRRYRAQMVPSSWSFPSDLMKPRRILVCLPAGLRELTLVKSFLPTIAYLFKPADITLLAMPGIKVTDIYPRKGVQLMTPTVDQLNWSGLPKKSYLKTLQSQKYDMLLDMSIEPTEFVSAVLLSFPQAIRIGRGNHLGNPYYNFEIKTKYLRDERNIYRSMLATIGQVINRNIDNAVTAEGSSQ
jgi:hypothetical protein